MDNSRLTKIVFHGDLVEGKRKRGGQLLMYRHCFKEDFNYLILIIKHGRWSIWTGKAGESCCMMVSKSVKNGGCKREVLKKEEKKRREKMEEENLEQGLMMVKL